MDQDLSSVFKALGHPVRLEIVRRLIQQVHHCCQLSNNEQCCLEEPVCEFGGLVDDLELNKATLSNHLKDLRYAGLIDTVRDGRNVSIQANPERLRQVQQFFELEIDQKTEKWMKANAAGY